MNDEHQMVVGYLGAMMAAMFALNFTALLTVVPAQYGWAMAAAAVVSSVGAGLLYGVGWVLSRQKPTMLYRAFSTEGVE